MHNTRKIQGLALFAKNYLYLLNAFYFSFFFFSAIKFESRTVSPKYGAYLDGMRDIFLSNVYRECGNCSKKNNMELKIIVTSQHLSTDLYFGVDESYVINFKLHGGSNVHYITNWCVKISFI